MAKAKVKSPKKKSPTPRPAPAKAVVAEPTANGTELAIPTSAAPHTSIDLSFGIDNLVAIGIVHAKDTLGPQLEQEVAEIQRLGHEVSLKNADLHAAYTSAVIDPAYAKKCQTAIAAMEEVGIKLTLEMVKTGFNAESLKYNVAIRFRGEMSTARDYVLTDAKAEKLRDEIVKLRQQQNLHSKSAERTKRHLDRNWLDEQLRATIARNAMNQTQSGAEALRTMLADLDKALHAVAPSQLQLESD